MGWGGLRCRKSHGNRWTTKLKPEIKMQSKPSFVKRSFKPVFRRKVQIPCDGLQKVFGFLAASCSAAFSVLIGLSPIN